MISKSLKKSFKQLFPTIAFCSIFFHFLFLGKATKAQISPDGSIPTKVNQSSEIEITGGTEAGSNLFHSFEKFSVNTGQEAFFNNADNIANIFSRVTGSSVSEIDGLIRANGNANLFLLNPNGIIFGPNASLDIGGSFLATTAESLIFEDEITFDTKNLQETLLTINTPVGLQIGSGSGSIVNQSLATNNVNEVVGLKVNYGQDLTLIGGNVNLNSGHITAPGGQVNLGGLSAPGIVNLVNKSKPSFDGKELLADVSLDNVAIVNVRSDNNGGIAVNANNFSLAGTSGLLAGIAQGAGSAKSRAGDIDLDITETITISDGSFISNFLSEKSVGEGGNIHITASSLSLIDSARIDSITDGQGNAGDINIEATDSISVTNKSLMQTDTFRSGNAGDINIESENAAISFKGVETGVSTRVAPGARGQGGNINIEARELTMTTKGDSNKVGALLQASTFGQGDAGNIAIKADKIVFDGAVSGTLSAVVETGIGQGGNIDIQARSLSIKNGASIFTGTEGQGDAGNISIAASDSLVISGTAPYPTLADGKTAGGFASALYTATDEGAIGRGGDIRINTNDLQLTDGGVLSGRSRSSFPGGNITVNAKTLEITGGSQILTTAFQQGTAGDIILNISDNIDISGSDPNYKNRFNSVAKKLEELKELEEVEEQVTAEEIIDPISPESGIYANTTSSSTGDGGNISINSEQLNISDEGRISVATLGNGDGGNIFLQTQDLLTLRNNSQISAEGETRSNGGNITIDTDFVIASPNENSDIVTKAFEGEGGDIDINADSLFGIEERIATDGNETNDIDASSEFGLSGTVEINTPDVDRDRDLVQLPTQPTQTQIVSACTPDNRKEQSEFVIKGRGGLPSSPESVLDSDRVEVDWVRRSPQQNSSKITNPTSTQPAPIIEAQGWMVDGNEIVLVANNSQNKSWQNSPQCKQKAEGRRQKKGIPRKIILYSLTIAIETF